YRSRKSFRKRACLGDHSCSDPHNGQRVFNLRSGRALKLNSSVSIPTEKSFPVTLHFMTTVPIRGPPVRKNGDLITQCHPADVNITRGCRLRHQALARRLIHCNCSPLEYDAPTVN